MKEAVRRQKGFSRFESTGDLLRGTYCEKNVEDAPFHPLECILQECTDCGVHKLFAENEHDVNNILLIYTFLILFLIKHGLFNEYNTTRT